MAESPFQLEAEGGTVSVEFIGFIGFIGFVGFVGLKIPTN